ncbi:MAG: thiamine pyrophosphate-binding protein [Comamonas sp.]
MDSLISGAEMVTRALETLGVRCIFGVPSQHNLALYDALSRSGKIRVVGARHEAGAVHAADGYARATGELGVAVVSTGPGTANAMNGLYEAAFASSPVMLITTQINRAYLGRNKAFIHDAGNQFAMLQSVTRRTERVLHAQQLFEAVLALGRDIVTGRAQPGAIEIPTDLLNEQALASPRTVPPVPRIAPKADEIAAAAALIAEARRPLVWMGGGCVRSGAQEAVRAFVEHLGAPVATTLNGRSALPTDHPLAVGSATFHPPFRQLLEASDLVLAVGTRFQAVATAFWSLPLGKRLVQIDVDASMIGCNYPAAAGVVGDAGLALDALRAVIPGGSVDPSFVALGSATRQALLVESTRRIGPDHARLCEILDERLPRDRNIVCDATLVGNSWAGFRLPVRDFRGFTYSTSLSIGVALPLAIGAAIGSGRRTVAIHGDGGVMLNIGELATAVEAKARLTLIVFNDRGYGVLKMLQKAAGVQPFGVDLHTPDFVALGHAMGMPAERIESPDGFAAALDRSLLVDGPSLIEVDLTKMEALGL